MSTDDMLDFVQPNDITFTEERNRETEDAMSEKKQIVAAICKSMGEIGKLSKENMNEWDKFQFTSVDDFLAATGRVCAENGIVIVQDEQELDIVSRNDKQWIKIQFEFTVMHSSGESLSPVKRTVAVPFTGAQAFGSGQSYALKQFMRSLFQIATGDNDDPDGLPPQTPPADVVKKPVPPSPPAEPEKIRNDQKVAMIAASKLNGFQSDKHFIDWATAVCKKPIGEITAFNADAVIAFLECQKPFVDWPELHRKLFADTAPAESQPGVDPQQSKSAAAADTVTLEAKPTPQATLDDKARTFVDAGKTLIGLQKTVADATSACDVLVVDLGTQFKEASNEIKMQMLNEIVAERDSKIEVLGTQPA